MFSTLARSTAYRYAYRSSGFATLKGGHYASPVIPDMMMAAQIERHGTRLDVMEVPVPKIGKGQVLVKMMASGVCHTDVHAVDGDWPVKSRLPLIPGHEGAGVVVKIADDVQRVKVGDRVGIPWLHTACGCCEFCVSGWETLCYSQHMTGYSVNGCYSEYVQAQGSHVVKIPDEVSFEQAAPLLCAGVTSYKGLKETETKPGEFCTIIGAAGGLGHLAIQYAKALGMVVGAVDVGADKLEYCRSLGADFCVDATDKDCAEQVTQITGGGSHGVLVLATSAGAFDAAVHMARRKGTLVSVGLPPGSFPTPIFEIVLKRVTLRGSIVGTRQDLVETLDFAARGLIKASVETDNLENINHIFDKLRASQVEGRIVLDFCNEGHPNCNIRHSKRPHASSTVRGRRHGGHFHH
mmetsp:Transcript_2081/g.2166  ORF Transcript_2081/g.2166 Transcript_2081/m.2166 type:complete len:408 (+) Transcript_2081:70-1293(+)